MTGLILAVQDSGQGGNALIGLLPFIAIIALFYFVIFRPQRRRMQDHRALMAALQIGDEVETIGGAHGVIRRLSDDAVWVEVSAGTEIKFSRGAIRRRVSPEPGSGEAASS